MYRQIITALLLLSALFCAHVSYAQVPQGINFQGIARDASGLPVANSVVTVGIRILDGSSTVVFEENHGQTTDIYGLFKVVIGNGTNVSGTFNTINWGASQHSVEVLINGSSLATIAFQSVPYAMMADQADMGLGELNDVDLTGIAANEVLQWSGTQWAPAGMPTQVWTQAATDVYYDAGDVAIGHTNPSVQLDVQDANYQLRLANPGTGGIGWYVGSSSNAWSTGAGDLVFSPTNTTTNPGMVISSNREVGLGVSNPVGRLNVSPFGSIDNSGTLNVNNAGLLIGTGALGLAFDLDQIEKAGTGELFINFNSASHIRMAEGGGFVGIGTPTISFAPTAQLQVNQSSNTAGGGIRLVQNGSSNIWDLYQDGTGNLALSYQAVARGSFDLATGAYTSLSDRRAKTNIVAMGTILNKVLELQPYHYQYLDEVSRGTSSMGFIAQEVAPIFPEIVNSLGEYQGVNYAAFSVLAIKAIQEQQDLIEQQEDQLMEQNKRLNRQEAELKKLQAEMEAIKAMIQSSSSK